MGTNQGLRLFQWGKESTRGTAVAATSKMAVEDAQFSPEDSIYRPALAKGLAHRNPGSETVVMRGTKFSIPETPVVYDQLQHLFSMAIKGGVTSTGSNPYTWTFVRSLTADPAPDSWTLERRLTDGASPKDNEWAYCLLSKIRFTYQQNGPLKFSADGFARRVQASTLTAALSLPATIEIPPTPLVTCYIDSTWANLGVTQISAQVLAATAEFTTGFKPKPTFDGRADLDFTTYIWDPSAVGLDLSLRMLVAGQYDTEKTAAEALTARAVRLNVLGTSSRQLRLDMLLKHKQASIFKVGTEDGQDIVEMDLADTDDGTNMFQAVAVNAVNTYA